MVVVNLMHNATFNLLAYLMIFILLNYVVFELKNPKDILLNISFFLVVFLLLDTLSYILLEAIFSFKENANSFFVTNLKMVTASLMQFVAYNILKNFVLKKEIHTLSKKDLFSYFFVSISSILVTYLFTLFSDDVNGNIKLFFFTVVLGFMLINIWYIKTLEALSQKNELEKSLYVMSEKSRMLFQHYHSLEEKEEQTRRILHDIKNHLQVLEKAVQETGVEEKEYLNEVKNTIDQLTTKVIIDRKILNILFIEKIEEASKYKIEIRFHIDHVDTSFIKDFDIITIFSNILDNAIDAVKEVPEKDRLIDINIRKVYDFLLICEMNPCMNTLQKNKGKILTNKKGHSGLGLQNIEQVLKNYDANMVVEIDEDLMFSNTIMFTM
ncbi:sensor histidine kinase [Amedibacillus sp. YH-ame10]